jgi:hypothetical protein
MKKLIRAIKSLFQRRKKIKEKDDPSIYPMF